jgi:hypothetical protein
MNDWKKYNEEVKQAIEEPTKKDKLRMDEVHLTIYELNQEKVSLSQSLKEVEKKLEKYYNRINEMLQSDDPPNWAWSWIFKKSSIKWKDEFIKRLGKAEANKILSATKQKEFPKIGVRFIDPNPDQLPETPIDKAKKTPKRLTLPEPKLTLKERLAKMKGN